MKKEIYVSWCKGLADSEEALKILRESPYVTGVETLNYDRDEKKFQKAGLKVSIHNPTRFLNIDLSDSEFIDVITSKENSHMLNGIRTENAYTAGFHICHKIYFKEGKLVLKDEIDEKSITIHDEEVVFNNILNNLLQIEKLINKGFPEDKKKKVLFETNTFYDPKILEKRDYKSEKEKLTVELVKYFSSLEFYKKILNHPKIHNENFGLLFDVAHVIATASTNVLSKIYKGTQDDFINELINISKGRVYQLHLNAPKGNLKTGIIDGHKSFTLDEPKTELILGYAKEILNQNPNLTTVTLEMYTNQEPVKHAQILAEQAELVAKKLDIEVEK
ncbi:MAG: hypothetical protein KKF46_02605 [Nanoarchaeota archaeon]|nr:hypothetical protein [Nanoarchaeota archaeon]MBU1321222.1 hypothetical protein [Nanoarchaeota archaeon]MBU1597027.1 hypothetical protein [Nanoarchaeota archaeon]MBU2441827.1 hypothetical protein [Nanoarchaeota archaeon]